MLRYVLLLGEKKRRCVGCITYTGVRGSLIVKGEGKSDCEVTEIRRSDNVGRKERRSVAGEEKGSFIENYLRCQLPTPNS